MDKKQYLSPNFQLGEFLHTETRSLPVSVMEELGKLALALENARLRLGNRAISITSGFRTVKHNREVGGAKNSYHLKGMAADIVVEGLSSRQVQVILKDWPGGMGLSETFTHLDIRPYRARFHYGS